MSGAVIGTDGPFQTYSAVWPFGQTATSMTLRGHAHWRLQMKTLAFAVAFALICAVGVAQADVIVNPNSDFTTFDGGTGLPTSWYGTGETGAGAGGQTTNSPDGSAWMMAYYSTLGQGGVLLKQKNYPLIAEMAYEIQCNDQFRARLLKGQVARAAAFAPDVARSQIYDCLKAVMEI